MKDTSKKPDDFWDLDALMPPRRSPSPFAKDTSSVSITFGDTAETKKDGIPIPPPDPERLARARNALKRAEEKVSIPPVSFSADPTPSSHDFPDEREREYLQIKKRRSELELLYRGGKDSPPPPPPPDPMLLCEYKPSAHPLLLHVKALRTTRPAPPDAILEATLQAHSLLPPQAEPPKMPYHAAIPSFSELSDECLSYYLHLRALLEDGGSPSIDGSYLYLYLYEVLNLTPIKYSPERTCEILCRIWHDYRRAEPRLDYLIPEWLCDLCLLHNLPLPSALTDDLKEIAIRVCSLKELFLTSNAENISPFALAVFRYGCNYRYHESKFLTEENRALFEEHIPAAFFAAFSALEEAERDSQSFGICSKRALQSRMVRQTFAGSAFTRDIKHRIEVTYLSCTRSVELRFMATDLVKYIENRIRRLLGIKSRFHTAHLDPRLKAAVDAYFAPLHQKNTASRVKVEKPTPVPEWEALYAAAPAPLSIDEAKRIETSAWSVTHLLVDAFDEGEEESPSPEKPAEEEGMEAEPPVSPPAVQSTPQAVFPPHKQEENEETADSLLREAFACLLRKEPDALRALAAKHHMMPLTLTEQMNEAALLEIGDIAVVEENGIPRLLDDYKEEITQWMKL